MKISESFLFLQLMKILGKIENRPGVYCVECLIDQRIYIGSSKNVLERLHDHYNCLIENCHPNRLLDEAVQVYGPESFIAFLLEYHEDHFALEQYYIDLFLYGKEYRDSDWTDHRFHKYGFNLNPNANGGGIKGYKNQGSPRPKSERHKDKLRNAAIKKYLDEEYKERFAYIKKIKEHRENVSRALRPYHDSRKYKLKPILCYNAHTGLFEKEYKNIIECAQAFNVKNNTHLYNALNGEVQSAYGKIFRYKELEDFPLSINHITSRFKYYEVWKEKAKIGVSRKMDKIIVKLNYLGEIIEEFEGIEIAVNKYGNDIVVAIEHRIEAYGYFWKTKAKWQHSQYGKIGQKISQENKNKVPIICYSKENMELIEEFKTLKDIEIKYGYKSSRVIHHLKGESNYVGDHIFKRKNN